jgi:hypothetical protein
MEKLLAVIQSYLSVVKDLVTIISLTIAGFVAIIGLQTWRRQLKGTAEYELAKRLLKATYQLRDRLQAVRDPLILAAEFSYAVKEMQLDIKHEDPEFHAASTAAVYQMRWKPVVEAYQDLELVAFEAETVWGSKVKSALNTIRGSLNTLNTALRVILEDMKPQVVPRLDKLSRDTYRSIVYSVSSKPEDDPFLKELNPAIKAIEELARPYLAR